MNIFLHWHTYAIPKHGLRRQINWVSGKDESATNNVAFIQYTLPANVTSVNFVPQKHGNTKKAKNLFSEGLHIVAAKE